MPKKAKKGKREHMECSLTQNLILCEAKDGAIVSKETKFITNQKKYRDMMSRQKGENTNGYSQIRFTGGHLPFLQERKRAENPLRGLLRLMPFGSFVQNPRRYGLL